MPGDDVTVVADVADGARAHQRLVHSRQVHPGPPSFFSWYNFILPYIITESKQPDNDM